MTCFETGFSVLLDIKTWDSWMPMLSLVVAIGALCTAYYQVQVGRSATATAQAHNIYQQYLVLCMDNPDLASGEYRPSSAQDERYAQYTWFFQTCCLHSNKYLKQNQKMKSGKIL